MGLRAGRGPGEGLRIVEPGVRGPSGVSRTCAGRPSAMLSTGSARFVADVDRGLSPTGPRMGRRVNASRVRIDAYSGRVAGIVPTRGAGPSTIPCVRLEVSCLTEKWLDEMCTVVAIAEGVLLCRPCKAIEIRDTRVFDLLAMRGAQNDVDGNIIQEKVGVSTPAISEEQSGGREEASVARRRRGGKEDRREREEGPKRRTARPMYAQETITWVACRIA